MIISTREAKEMNQQSVRDKKDSERTVKGRGEIIGGGNNRKNIDIQFVPESSR